MQIDFLSKRMLATAMLACLASGQAKAQSCSFGISGMSFGQIDTLSGAPADSSTSMSINCTGLPLTRILICPGIGSGSGGATASARQLASGGNQLDYQLYVDSGRSVVWGSNSWPFAPGPPAYPLTLGVLGQGSGTVIIYGRLFGGQASAPPGSYLSSFSGSDVEIYYRYTTSSDCSTSLGNVERPGFTVSATVPANCQVNTQDVDFGARGVLATNVDATGEVDVTCTPGSAYTISLDGGNAGAPPTQREMSKGTETVIYGLYRDAARSQPWGSTAGTTVSGSGSGSGQSFTVYGRVPPQHTPSPGTYVDTVVVTVTY
ncbi:spore coat U domain-containing protein [Nitratireductor rhodophyticola]|uniref:Csu type fimbrial protein n=1 Tax=Nitratireductor rhodophyticola TaxID=2854036 RepID=UPI002AC9E542|nr:spore coat U domain-containing protein [Nitratireductor rhodophyticola]WPZ14834.1 spore coat U domain-containing protein [Nitratireductor rhodophyticola]